MPVIESFVGIFEGEVFQKTLRDVIIGVAVSNNRITRKSMGNDLREQIHNHFGSSLYTALAIAKSTYLTSKAQLLVHGQFACGCHIVEEPLCCLTWHSTTTGHNIFSAVETFFTEKISLRLGSCCRVLNRRHSIDDGKKQWIDFEVYFKENILTSASTTASFIDKLWLPKSFHLCSKKWCT